MIAQLSYQKKVKLYDFYFNNNLLSHYTDLSLFKMNCVLFILSHDTLTFGLTIFNSCELRRGGSVNVKLKASMKNICAHILFLFKNLKAGLNKSFQ